MLLTITEYLFAQVQPDSLSSGRWVLLSDQPAECWEDAFVTGNGSHGTMILGQPGKERIINVHEELFLRNWDREIVGVPKIAQYLPEMLQFIANGENEKAYFVNIPSKFISEDGLTMWLCYSANYALQTGSPKYSRYAMMLREFTLMDAK